MFANPMSARVGGMNDGKIIVSGFDKRQSLADFMKVAGVGAHEIHGILWLQEGSIGVHFKEIARAQEFANQINGRR